MSPDTINIEIADEQTHTFDGEALIAIAREIVSDYQYSAVELSIAIVDDPTIRRLNNQYLGHDYETDVISFVLDESDDSLTGQLIVSTDTAIRESKTHGASMQHELMLYVAHGTLHLVGLDDTDEQSAKEMRDGEREYLGRFNIEHHWQDSTSASDEEGSPA